MSKAVLFFADGTEECEALLVADLLRRARVEVIIASAMGRRALVSSHGIHLNADALAEDGPPAPCRAYKARTCCPRQPRRR